MRTGDTSADERRNLVRNPPDLLITTPESLYLMLTSAARETLLGVDSVIIDEIHALAATKRGAHLALTLERLEHLVAHAARRRRHDATEPPPPTPEAVERRGRLQRIGLSATQRPARGDRPLPRWRTTSATTTTTGTTAAPSCPGRCTIVDAGMRKPLELEVVVPVEDMGALGEIGPGQSGAGGGRPGALDLAGDAPASCSSWSRSTAPP